MARYQTTVDSGATDSVRGLPILPGFGHIVHLLSFYEKKACLSFKDHFFMSLLGFTLYGLSYCMSYLSTLHLTSGPVAVIFSTVLMWNILNLRLYMGQAVAWRAFSGGALGLIGICILFWPELIAFTATQGLIGVILALTGAYLVSVGNVFKPKGVSPTFTIHPYKISSGKFFYFYLTDIYPIQ